MRVAFIAPVVPYRGGIAQHSSMLANALATTCDLKVISYRRLYPNWLYPGKSTTDPHAKLDLKPECHFLIDTMNPLSWAAATSQVFSLDPTMVLLPWWTIVLAPLYSYLLDAFRRKGLRVALCCHNVVDHEGAAWKRLLAARLLRRGDLFIVHTRKEEERLRELVSEPEILTYPHPVYTQFPAPRQELPRRAPLELLFFGTIRPYKGLDVLLQALAMAKDLSFHLSIVGQPWWNEGERIDRLLHAYDLEGRTEKVMRYVSDQEAADYFARADAVVLPYRDATTTGVVATAYHYRKPIIGSRVAGLMEVAVEGKNALLSPPGSPAALAQSIRNFVKNGLPDADRTTAELLETMTWSGLAKRITDGMAAVAGER